MHQSIPAAPCHPPPPPPPKVTAGHLPTDPHFENEGKYKTYLVLMSSLWEHSVFRLKFLVSPTEKRFFSAGETGNLSRKNWMLSQAS